MQANHIACFQRAAEQAQHIGFAHIGLRRFDVALRSHRKPPADPQRASFKAAFYLDIPLGNQLTREAGSSGQDGLSMSH